MGDVILYKEDVDRLNLLLTNLIVESKVLSALLITKDTRVLSCQGTLAAMDTSALAALLVGSFASTQAIAGLIGETEFDTMSHCGKVRNVIISLVDDDTILASVYDNASSVQRITTCLNKHLAILRKSLKAIGTNTTDDLFSSAGSPSSSADDAVEFEKRTDDLFKGIEPDPEDTKPKIKEPSLTIAKPPETQMVEIQASENAPIDNVHFGKADQVIHDRAAISAEHAPLTSKDYDVYSLNDTAHPGLNQGHSPDKRMPPPPGTKTETITLSMSYLKNKAREGVVYYKRDEAIFKKIFKSAKKKKSDLKSKIS